MKTNNVFIVHFKDGTKLESKGQCENYMGQKSSIKTEFDWTSFHIEKELISEGKSLSDVLKVEYTLNYLDS